MQPIQTRILKLFLVAAACGCTSSCLPQEVLWGERTGDLQLGLVFEKAEVHLGEPVDIGVVLKNFSDAVQLLPTYYPLQYSYQFVVTRDRAEPVAAISYGPQPTSGRGHLLAANAEETNQIRLSALFHITKPGTYIVTASRQIAAASGEIQLRSGDAVIRVVENATATPFDQGAPSSGSSVQNTRSPTGTRNTAPQNGPSRTADLPQTTPFPSLAAAPTETNQITPVEKTGAGIIVVLLALLLAILWRASRRKPEKHVE